MTERECWSNLTLAALRLAWDSRRDPDDQPAALDWDHDEDGGVHMVPLSIEGVMVWAARLLDDESEALD
jgi:hypothetical protein